MPSPQNLDLFESSKMTFGQHLDELRSALMKALLALAVGFLVGLLFGGNVVSFLQIPVVDALEGYYSDKAVDDYVEMINQRLASGQSVPAALENIDQMSPSEIEAAAKELAGESQMLPEEVYFQPSQLLGQLKASFPNEFDGVELPALTAKETLKKENMIRLHQFRPMKDDPRTRLKSLASQEAFMVYIKASLLTGILVGSPLIFYFLWSFVASGLFPHEKKYVYIFLPFSLLLFLAGAALAFFAVFQFVLGFLFAFNTWMGIDPDLRINEWLSFVMLLPIGFGVSFQLPLVMLFLERIGVFSVASYLEKWRIAVLVIFVISMLLTPADPSSMILMALPLTVLYFGGILLCHFMPRRTSPIS